jgi:hypothetical protein
VGSMPVRPSIGFLLSVSFVVAWLTSIGMVMA